MGELFDALRVYGKSNTYPFHMPGHKRQMTSCFNPCEIDITEIEGFDNLHHAEGILLKAQQRAAKLYGSEETHFLINGSTAGILSAVSACAQKTLLLARNCHKSAYHAAFIRNLDVHYVYPEVQEEFLLNGGIRPADVEQKLLEHPEIEAVLLTSPTYDGIVSDIKKIAEIVHRHGKPLIVDEAHGAHFGFSDYFPENSVSLGADIVIHSLHKTLPAYTQTALLHVNGKLVNREKLRFFLQVYQTSSPSYILMTGIDECIRFIQEQGKTAFEEFEKRLEEVYIQGAKWKHIRLADRSIIGESSIFDFDRSKLIFSVKNCGITGNEFQKILREMYGLEFEMAAGTYALALTSVCDTEEGFARLIHSMGELDLYFGKILSEKRETEKENFVFPIKDTVTNNRIFCTINQAFEAKKRRLRLADSEGWVSGEFLYLYPPGIPLLVPGEWIDSVLLERIFEYRKKGFQFQGAGDFTGETIEVLEKQGTDKKVFGNTV